MLKGRKGVGYFRRRHGRVMHQEPWRRGGVGRDDVERLLGMLLDLYRVRGGRRGPRRVHRIPFSPIQRRPRAVRILPVELPADGRRGPGRGRPRRWHHEPGLAGLIDELLAVYLRVQVYDVLLESYASEQGARMITMEEATERAETDPAGLPGAAQPAAA